MLHCYFAKIECANVLSANCLHELMVTNNLLSTLTKFLLIRTGMNTGIQDAHNLAWKLASVLKDISPSSFLKTYEAERRPVSICSSLCSIIFIEVGPFWT